MGGEATPGLGVPEDEELLGRVSRDRALCMPEACMEVLLPAPLGSTLNNTLGRHAAVLQRFDIMTDTYRHRQTDR